MLDLVQVIFYQEISIAHISIDDFPLIFFSNIGVAAIGQFIYVVGGYEGARQLCSVERYDTEKGDWEFMAPLRVARSALSLTALDGKLWAMGGYDGSNFSTVVEVYDPLQNVWTDGVPLTSGRSGHAAAVIYQPSNITGIDVCEALPERGGTSGNRQFDSSKKDANGPCGPGRNQGAMFENSSMFGGGGNCSSMDRECCRENGENCLVNQHQSNAPCKRERIESDPPNPSPARRRLNNELEERLRNYRRLKPSTSNANLSRSNSRQNIASRSVDDNFELPYNIDVDLLDFTNRIYYCERCANNTCNTNRSVEPTIKGRHTCPGAILKRAVLRFLTNFTSSNDHKRGNSNNRPCKRL